MEHNPLCEMQPSYCQELDVQGMQPHSREYLEYKVLAERSRFKAAKDPRITKLERPTRAPYVQN